MKKLLSWRLLYWAPFPLALGIRALAARNPEGLERHFSMGLYPRVAAPLSRLMALCPVPVVELSLIALIGYILFMLWKRQFFRIIACLGAILALFFAGWGLNYLRPPLEATFSLPVAASAPTELIALCGALAEDANAAYTLPPEELLSHVPAAMDAAAETWPLPQGDFARPKMALSSPLLTRATIEGITSPFTAEALVNGQIPAMSLPYTACHEAAHVRGIAREEDANLVAYLACRASGQSYFRYSGAISALQSALNALRKADEAAYLACLAQLDPAVRDDLSAHAAFWAPYYDTKVAEVSGQINNTYLQTVSSGEQSTRSYGRVVDLLLALQRKEGN